MKKSFFLYTIVIIAIVFSSVSCSKKEAPVAVVSNTALITGKTWIIESVNMAGMNMTSAEIIKNEGGEYQMVLNVDGTITYTDNAGMNPTSGKWAFQTNETQFKVSGINATSYDVNTIDRLSATELWFWHMDGVDKMIMHYKLK